MTMPPDIPTLPEGWVWTKLADICETTSGGTPSRKEKRYYKGDIPWLKSGELENNTITSAEEYITVEGLKNSSAKIIPKGTLLMALYGATVGKLGILGIDSAINQAICAIYTNSQLEKKYLFWYLMNYRSELLNARIGGVQPNISQSIVNKIVLPLPPLPEQHRIVTKIEELFTKLDAGVDELKMVKAQLKRYRQSVLKYAFEGKLTKKWRELHKSELEPASGLLEQIKEERKKNAKGKYKELAPLDISDLPELPEGWMWTRVGELVVVVRGGSPRPKGDPRYFGGNIPWIMISDISREKGKYISKTKDTVTKEGARKSRYLKAGTLILSNSGTVCVPKILAVDGCIHDGFVAFPDISDETDILYLYYFFDYIRPKIIQENKQGVTQVNLNTNIVRNIIICVSPLAEQHKIVEEIEHRFSVADEVEKVVEQSLKQAERLHQSILKKAFEGKLVPQNPNDEPASLLIERIKKERALIQSKEKKKKRIKTKPRVKRQEKMDREFEAEIKTKSLYKILKSSKKPLTPEELWKLSKLDIDDFYTQLKKEVEKGMIMERRPNETEVFLEVEK